MSVSGALNIALHRLTREDLAARIVDRIVEGRGSKADVFAVEVDGVPAVVKDFSRRSFWGRLLGRFQIARESRAYARLEGVPGVPRFYGRIDRWALAVERIDGERLAFVEVPAADAPRHLARLRAIMDAIHARGVAHNDLRGRENVILRRDGDLAVVDFAAAVHLRPGGIAHRLLFRSLCATDEAALLKWKGMLAPGSYTDADRELLRRFERRRALWPFNPKRRKSPGALA